MKEVWRGALALLLFVATAACSAEIDSSRSQPAAPHIVILMADDLGLDVAPCHSPIVRMPYLESLCERSFVFRKAYTHPVCTPSRATFFTSRHPFQHRSNDVSYAAEKLALEEITFLERLKDMSAASYQTAGFGKWHLGDDANGDLRSPNLQGFDHFEGTPRQHHTYSYWNFDWWENGERVADSIDTYRTTFIVDRVLDYFERRASARPQMIFVGFTSPHLPYHAPPNELHSFDELGTPLKRGPLKQTPQPGYYEANTRDGRLDPFYFATLEALDHEIARLTGAIGEASERPVIFIFAGDNGSSAEVYQGDISAGYRAKGMLYDGGAAVPVQVWSTGAESDVKPATSDRLFHFADFGPTLLSLAGMSESDLERVEQETYGINQAAALKGQASFQRSFLYLERGTQNGAPFAFGSVDADGYKLILWESGDLSFPALAGFSPSQIEFYATTADPGEKMNLFTTCQADFDRVRAHFNFISELIATEGSSEVPFDAGAFEALIKDQAGACGSL